MRSSSRRRARRAFILLLALGCSKSTVPPSVESEIALRIAVRESRTIFTLFAFLNAAGYDEENRASMHPVRLHIRKALESRLPASAPTGTSGRPAPLMSPVRREPTAPGEPVSEAGAPPHGPREDRLSLARAN